MTSDKMIELTDDDLQTIYSFYEVLKKFCAKYIHCKDCPLNERYEDSYFIERFVCTFDWNAFKDYGVIND